MNNFENFKSLSLEELAHWLDVNVQSDDSAWALWFDANYCKKCEPIEMSQSEYRNIFGCSSYSSTMTCAYCEVKGKCKFFPNVKEVMDNSYIIELWLKENIDD